MRRANDQGAPVFRDGGRALRPESGDSSKPSENGEAESPLDCVRSVPELLREATRSHERDVRRTASEAPAFPDEPDIEVKQSGCIRQGRDNLALDRNPVLVAFAEGRVAERCGILNLAVFTGRVGIGKPQAHAFEEVKSSAIGHLVAARLIICTEENCRGENTLKAFDDPAVMPAIFGEVKELEHLRCAAEADKSATLLESERRDPDRDEPVLTAR